MEMVFNEIKRQFNELWHLRNDQIITPFSALNDHFASVFINSNKSGYTVSDGGWLQGGEYSEGFKYEESDILIEMFEVKCGNSEYTMFTEDEEFVPNLIYNMANFIVTSINFNYITKNQKTKTL